MSRVTRVIGDSSGTPPTARRRRGRFKMARGYSRCSGCTPTACVGTRTNRRGCPGTGSGARRSAGPRGLSGTGCGPRAGSRASANGLGGQDSNRGTHFVALITPSETAIHFRRLAAGLKAAATSQQTELAFWNFPVHTCAVWSAKMALEVGSVNLWKTSEVS
jgi:hypothetical protein